jgi:hypothetical protein
MRQDSRLPLGLLTLIEVLIMPVPSAFLRTLDNETRVDHLHHRRHRVAYPAPCISDCLS